MSSADYIDPKSLAEARAWLRTIPGKLFMYAAGMGLGFFSAFVLQWAWAHEIGHYIAAVLLGHSPHGFGPQAAVGPTWVPASYAAGAFGHVIIWSLVGITAARAGNAFFAAWSVPALIQHILWIPHFVDWRSVPTSDALIPIALVLAWLGLIAVLTCSVISAILYSERRKLARSGERRRLRVPTNM